MGIPEFAKAVAEAEESQVAAASHVAGVAMDRCGLTVGGLLAFRIPVGLSPAALRRARAALRAGGYEFGRWRLVHGGTCTGWR